MEIWAEKLKFWMESEVTLLHAEFGQINPETKTILVEARKNLNIWFAGKKYYPAGG